MIRGLFCFLSYFLQEGVAVGSLEDEEGRHADHRRSAVEELLLLLEGARGGGLDVGAVRRQGAGDDEDDPLYPQKIEVTAFCLNVCLVLPKCLLGCRVTSRPQPAWHTVVAGF